MSEHSGAERMPVHARLSAIQSLLEVRRPLDAIALANEGLASDPDDAGLLAAKGQAHLLAGEVGEARTWLRRSLASDPEDPFVHHLLADALLEGRPDRRGALRSAQEAVRRDPTNPHFIYNLVRVHLAWRKLDQAALAARAIRERAPYSYLGPLCDALLALGRVDRLKVWAIGVGAGVLGVTRGAGVILLPFVWLGYALARAGHLRAADEALQETLARAPNEAWVRLVASEVLAQRFRYSDSVSHQVTAAAVDTGLVDAGQLARSIAERLAGAVLWSATTWAAVTIAMAAVTEHRLATFVMSMLVVTAIVPALVWFDRWQTRALPPLVLRRVHQETSPIAAAGLVAIFAGLFGRVLFDGGLEPGVSGAHLAALVATPLWAGLTASLVWRKRRSSRL